MGYWSDRLNGVNPSPTVVPPSPVYNPYPQQHQQPQQPQPGMVGSGSTITVAPSTERSSSGRCPSCGGDDYMHVENAKARCFDCGYPLVQFASGMGQGSTVAGVGRGEGTPAPRPASMDTEANLQTWDPAQGGAGKIG